MVKVRQHIHRITPAIPTSSMADIAFLLIIFFLVTTTFSADQTTVELPTSVNREEVYRESALITVPANGDIKVTDGDYSESVRSDEELDQFIQRVLANNPARPFVIKGDRAVAYQRVESVLERLRSNRTQTVYFLTEARAPRR